MVLLCMFCFNQKTAYEMRMSDWSSDVCSSDLTSLLLMHRARKVDDRFVLAFTVAAGFGDVVPFLAEGDRVEMAVQLFEDSPIGREPPVSSEERRVGKERVSRGRSRSPLCHEKKNNISKYTGYSDISHTE